MDDFRSLYGRYPDISVRDAGYGSGGNYLYAFRRGIETLVKYNYFHNKETDGVYCPTEQRVERPSDARWVTNDGFVRTISRYKARNYKDCLLRCRCYRSRSERIVQVNHRLRRIKEREREGLLSDEGLKYRNQRPQGVGAVFEDLKNNKHFRRLHLHGFKEVEIEFALLAMVYNLTKVTSQEAYGNEKAV